MLNKKRQQGLYTCRWHRADWNRVCPKAPMVRNLLPVGLLSWGLQRMARGLGRYGALRFPIAQTVQGTDHVSVE